MKIHIIIFILVIYPVAFSALPACAAAPQTDNLQSQIDAIIPPAPNRLTMQTNRGNTLEGHVQIDSGTRTLQAAPLPGRSAPPQYGLVDLNIQFRPIKGHLIEQQSIDRIQQSPAYPKFSPVKMVGEESLPIQDLYAKLAGESDPSQMAFYQLQPLHGLFAKLGRPKSKRLQGQAEVGIPGIMFQQLTHIVMYVDPHSDAYGKVFPGDRESSVNGMDPEILWRQHKLGVIDERAYPIVFVRNGTMVFTVYCKNYPIRIFPAFMQKSLWTPVYL